MKTSAQQLKDAIDGLFSDTSVPVEETIERLEEVLEHLLDSIQVLHDQINE